MISKSFIDVLFILLCATIVLLSESVHVGAVATEPARIGSGGIDPVQQEDVRIVAVGPSYVNLDDQRLDMPLPRITNVAGMDDRQACYVVVPAEKGVAHQRVMDVWSELQQQGVDVRLGAKPGRAQPTTSDAADIAANTQERG